MAQNLQNHHVSICAKRKFLSIFTRKKVMIEKLKDQTSKRVGKCVDAVVPSTSADIQFLRHSRPLQPRPEPPTCSSVTSVTSVPESALDYLSDSSSTNTDQTQSSAASQFVSQSMPYENQNRMI